MGRPPKLNDEKRDAILSVLKDGGSQQDAAIIAGVTWRTLRAEIVRNKEFERGILSAETSGKLELIKVMMAAGKGDRPDWRAAAFMLERKHWREFARRSPDKFSLKTVTEAFERLITAILPFIENEKQDAARIAVSEAIMQLAIQGGEVSSDESAEVQG